MNQPEQNQPKHIGKEPWLAVNLSWLLPGLGQLYTGKYRKGWAILFGYYLLAAISIWFFIDPLGNVLVGMAILAVVLLVLLINLFDAHRTARNGNSSDFESARRESKDAWLAVFLSGFIPGLGHIYLKKWTPAILFILAFVLTSSGVFSASPLFAISCLILRFIISLMAIYFAYKSTPIRRYVPEAWVGVIIAGFLGISVLLSAITAFTLRLFVAESRYIPSGAMTPTLAINDRVVINKLVYRFQSPERGDIIVFNPTENLKKEGMNEAFIKRIIGIPGDQVEIKVGQVFVNNKLLTESYIMNNTAGGQDFPTQVVPPNSYLVLGDNRSNSYDSRYWGFVPRENIIGKATQRFWPIDRISSITGK
jgi:signal peptidase I